MTKGIVVGSNVEGSSSKQPQSTEEMKGKGKGITIEPTAEEKKMALEVEMEKMQIQNILRQRQSDPPGLEKGHPMKHYCYETIKALVFNWIMYEFEMVPKKSYVTENSEFNQLDFPVNEMMFTAAQYQIVDKFEDNEEYK